MLRKTQHEILANAKWLLPGALMHQNTHTQHCSANIVSLVFIGAACELMNSCSFLYWYVLLSSLGLYLPPESQNVIHCWKYDLC